MNFRKMFQDLTRYPSALIGLTLIFILVFVSILTVIFIPYSQAINMWRGGEDIWGDTPRLAQPKWVNWFRANDLPESIIISSEEGYENAGGTFTQTDFSGSDGFYEKEILFTFDYEYGDFPEELTLFFTSDFDEKEPFVDVYWVKPNGEEIRINSLAIGRQESYRVSQDEKLRRKLNDIAPHQGLLLVDTGADAPEILKGTYQVRLDILAFDSETIVDAKVVMFGKVYGWAGTDHRRRGLHVAMLWGTPIAMAFGLLAALGTSVSTMVIAATGVWFGGWVDDLIQRITEVNLVLPVLPILIMIGTFYSRSIWLILGVIILLSIFGAAIKSYRAIFLQVKESPYIEAAEAYGSSNIRIVFQYLIPRIIPLLIPGLVTLIPSFVFLEASLAVLGLGDPVLPTWGKMINDARANGALFEGHYYWVLQPAILLMVTGLAFAMLGFSLDRIFNPRLRGL
jgi:peptide/nickel transport system permease protein